MGRKGETYIVFRERTRKSLRVLMCTVWKHRRHLADHQLRLDTAEERLDWHLKDIASLKKATDALAEIEARRIAAETAGTGTEDPSRPPRRPRRPRRG